LRPILTPDFFLGGGDRSCCQHRWP